MADRDFPAILAGIKAKTGLQDQEIAGRLGVDKTTYSRWATGAREPMSYRNIMAILTLAAKYKVAT